MADVLATVARLQDEISTLTETLACFVAESVTVSTTKPKPHAAKRAVKRVAKAQQGSTKPRAAKRAAKCAAKAQQGSSKRARTKPPNVDNLDEARRMVAMVREKQAKLKKTSRDEAEKRCAERFDKRKSEYRKGGKCRYPADEMDAYWEILRSEPCVLQCYPDVPELKPGGVATHGEASVTDDDEASVTDDDSNRMQNEQLIVLAATAVASGRMRTADDEDEDEEEATQDFNVNA